MRGSIAKLCRAHTSYRRRVRSSDRLSQADSTMWRQMNVRSRVSHLRLDQGLHFFWRSDSYPISQANTPCDGFKREWGG